MNCDTNGHISFITVAIACINDAKWPSTTLVITTYSTLYKTIRNDYEFLGYIWWTNKDFYYDNADYIDQLINYCSIIKDLASSYMS
jgi:hypothetical protein